MIVEYLTSTLWKPRPDYMRVSELITAPQVKRLKMRYWDQIEVDVRDLLLSMNGTALHLLFDKATSMPSAFSKYQTIWKEQNLELKIGGMVLKGSPDLYYGLHTDSTQLVFGVDDYKSTSVNKIAAYGVDKKWEAQTNVYRFLLNQYGKRVDKIKIIVFLRDWNKIKASVDKSYPQTAMPELPVTLWDEKDLEAYVIRRFDEHLKQLDMTEADFTDKSNICSPEDRWHKDDSWAIRKKGGKRATSLHSTEEEARKACKPGYEIEFRPGEDTFCKYYCDVAQHCPFKPNIKHAKKGVA